MSVSFPPPLKAGGTIGVISPSRWPLSAWLTIGAALLEKSGYRVVIHPQNSLQDGQLGGKAEQRAAAIRDMFIDQSIDAIICARGGTGAIQILDKLDYATIKQHPKPFIGFSDVTLVLHALHRQCGFTTFHGPMLWNLAHDTDARTITDLFQMIGLQNETIDLAFPGIEVVRPGKATGRITGGNITLLQNLVGTLYDWSAENAILFIEDTDEVIYMLAEKLQHLKLAGKFNKAQAVIVGEMTNIADGETCFARPSEQPYGRSLRQVLLDVLPPDVPLCFGFPCGHGKYLTTLPLGAMAEIAIDPSGVNLRIKRN